MKFLIKKLFHKHHWVKYDGLNYNVICTKCGKKDVFYIYG